MPRDMLERLSYIFGIYKDLQILLPKSESTDAWVHAAKSIDAAIAETRFHRTRFLAATNEPPIEIDMRSYASDLNAALYNIRGHQDTWPELYDPDPAHYGASRSFADGLRAQGSNGIAAQYREVILG